MALRLRSALAIPMLACLVACVTTTALARELTFEDRVDAQEAIERVSYTHQVGATRPFEEAVPRALLEAKVRRYMALSAALETVWKAPVTAAMLQGEARRLALGTRMPERLAEIYAALDHDAVLIEECYARPIVVEHVAREFFAYDRAIHARARGEAANLRTRLVSGNLDARAPHARRMVSLVRRQVDANSPDPARRDVTATPGEGGPRPLDMTPDAYREFRDRAPREIGLAGPLLEGADAFSVSVVLSETADDFVVASFVVPKTAWDEWWDKSAEQFDDGAAHQVIFDATSVPAPGMGSGLLCFDTDTWDNGFLGAVPHARGGHTAVWTGNLMVVWGGALGALYANTGGRYDPVADAWQPTSTTGAPIGKRDHTAVWTGSEMLIWGGASGTSSNSGGRYDPIHDTWTSITTDAAPSARTEHSAVWTGSVMVVWGGYSATRLNTGGRYDPVTDTWLPITVDGAPTGRYEHTAVWTGSRMIIWGGWDDTGAVNTGARYDPVGDTWLATSTDGAPAARRLQAGVWAGSMMIVWGGVAASAYTNTGGRYDPVNDAWSTMSTAGAPSGRAYALAVWTGDRVIIWGGYNASLQNTGGRYDPVGDSWSMTTTIGAPSGRIWHSAVWTGSAMIVWGGRLFSRNFSYNTGGRYDPIADTWLPTSTSGAPTGRSNHTAVWTGNVMVVWGGWDGTYQRTGGRYDPVADTWLPTAVTGAPTARQDHTAVWTGSVMIVWGGWDGAVQRTGGRYDPVADTWLSTATTNAPSGRREHTAIWTGTVMVVWGGYPASGGSGGRYNPVADTWQSTTSGAPADRYWHTAVWTGNVMVVWGGQSLLTGDSTSTGGRYNPVTDSWQATTLVEAPGRRWHHAAVWTGSEMIVWGGDDVATAALTAGRYDPVADSWHSISTADAPSGRSWATALWTGNVMVVWGGDVILGDVRMNTGGRYDPATNSWLPTSLINAPTARYLHTAVWTGHLMLVWGGDSWSFENTGGRYAPAALPSSVDGDADGVPICAGDCDDTNPGIHPGATETCDNLDNDCNGAIDGFQTSCGVGGCAAAGQCVAGADNCVPAPPAPEVCDGLDNNCSGIADEALPCSAMRLLMEDAAISWDPVPFAERYDVVWGHLDQLALSGGDYTLSTTGCAGGDITSASIPFPIVPGVGEALWVLARPENGAGPGTYDDAPGGAPGQAGRRDAEIAASAGNCP